MAKSAVIGALRVDLSIGTASFDKDLKRVQSGLAGLGKDFAKAAAAMAAAMTAAGAAVAVAMRGMAKEADALTKLSRSIGVPVEELSALKHAAELSGASVEQLGRLFRNVARNMQGAARAPSAFSRALDSLGIAWRDAEGNFIRADKLMLAVADKFAQMEDGAGKTALAMKIFGEEMGPKFVSLLNQGSAGIRAMMEEARQLGLVIDQETGEAAERFNDALDKMGKVQKGIITQITARMAPTFAMLAERMAETAKQSNVMRYAGDLLAGTLKALLTGGTLVGAVFRELGRSVAAVAGAIVAIAQGEFSAAARLVGQHWSNAKEAVAADLAFIRDLWAETAAQTAVTTQQFQERTAAPIVQSTRAMANEMRAFNEAARRALYDVIEAPTETFQAKMAALEESVRRGTISFEEFQHRSRQLVEANENAWTSSAQAIGGALQTVFSKSKAANVAAAIMNTAAAITQALKLPFPLNWAQAAAVAASGATQLAAIKSTNMGGGGRTPSVRGGSAAGGSEPQQAALPSQTLHVAGIAPGQLFKGEAIRELVGELLQFQRDGGRVILA